MCSHCTTDSYKYIHPANGVARSFNVTVVAPERIDKMIGAKSLPSGRLSCSSWLRPVQWRSRGKGQTFRMTSLPLGFNAPEQTSERLTSDRTRIAAEAKRKRRQGRVNHAECASMTRTIFLHLHFAILSLHRLSVFLQRCLTVVLATGSEIRHSAVEAPIAG